MKRKNLNQKEQDQLQKLKEENRNLKQKNKQLARQLRDIKSDNRTFKRAFNETVEFIGGEVDDLAVEDIVEAISRGKKLSKLVKKQYDEVQQVDKCVSEAKWSCYDCSAGVLRLVILHRRDGVFYYRRCTVCTRKTKLKKYHDDVEGIRES